MDYTITETAARAMGNAFKVTTHCDGMPVYVILCDLGVMGVFKALNRYAISYNDIQHISNIQADSYQRDNVPFFEIKEV